MKKWIGIVCMSSLLLVGCSEESDVVEEKEAEAPRLTEEQVADVVADLEQDAKADGVIESVDVKETDEGVRFSVVFPEGVTEEEQGEFLFHYSLFLQQLYPDQDVSFETNAAS